ncbi:MAG: acyl-ACP--UDP-N-acetylglucosamine O-acyltransferase [Bacteroidales bacterium]|nr:acyl-ACP--UDP-N-acetylglucosamine O-acyltransferase [Bacteroidales bacterium]
MAKIHPLACVHPNAKLAETVEVGPYAYIEEFVEIGENTRILPHATIFNYVKIGKDCNIFPGAVVGAIPQDLKFDGEITYVEIGDRVNIRECATINRGTKASGKGLTKIGNDVLLMSYSHVAHDCTVGNHCILVSYVGIAGETDVDDWAILGGGTVAHQFSKIGKHAMVGGGSKIGKDVPPYVLCGRDPLTYAGINLVGLRRRGFSNDQIRNIKDIYDVIYNSSLNFSDAVARIQEGFPDSPEKNEIVNFIVSSKRGIIRGPQNASSKDDGVE